MRFAVKEVLKETFITGLIRLFDLWDRALLFQADWKRDVREYRMMMFYHHQLEPVLCLVVIESWSHAFPSRTGSWNDSSPMIVWIAHVKVGRCQTHYDETPVLMDGGFALMCANMTTESILGCLKTYSPVFACGWIVYFGTDFNTVVLIDFDISIFYFGVCSVGCGTQNIAVITFIDTLGAFCCKGNIKFTGCGVGQIWPSGWVFLESFVLSVYCSIK